MSHPMHQSNFAGNNPANSNTDGRDGDKLVSGRSNGKGLSAGDSHLPDFGRIERRYTEEGKHPADTVAWELRSASIKDSTGKSIFGKEQIETPVTWSKTATDVVASRYLQGDENEQVDGDSIRNMIGRVARSIADWGLEQGVFLDKAEAAAFHDELYLMLLQQKVAFNSPVWFNVGVVPNPQVSACFINSVHDSLDGILKLAHTEGMLFKFGSGAGSNFSSIRSSQEALSGGGKASGPIPFLKGLDTLAGAIKSGGRTRRAAKMAILDISHPDVRDFITVKQSEEVKARALIEAGYDPGFNVPGGAYDSVSFQNTNHSVRASDDFMAAVETDEEWCLRKVCDGTTVETVRARELFRQLAVAAHDCGDPGIQFHTTINRWHTCKADGEIRASNPCSEFMFLDDSACNLASLNLLKFRDAADGRIKVGDLAHAVQVVLTAQEILVDAASYPNEAITQNSRTYRPLGLGYANLGALLMANGLPYDSDAGRNLAAAVTALITGAAYATSVELAKRRGPFHTYQKNSESVLGVLDMHRAAVSDLAKSCVGELQGDLLDATGYMWDEVIEGARQYGVRNSQVTLLAPTGTIAFMMDCDTTGVEPELALIKTKQLTNGGNLRIVNGRVEDALGTLGYSDKASKAIVQHLESTGSIEGAPGLEDRHLAVFDCAFRTRKGGRYIEPMGHIKMLAAVQPFLSGAVSKTVNLPSEATVEGVEDVFINAWKMGLKSVTIYRDGCKATQPLNVAGDKKKKKDGGSACCGNGAVAGPATSPQPLRRPLPPERAAITHRFMIQGHKGYLTVGLYPDGKPGELFITMAKQGSTVSGLTDAFATAVSLALQHGVPLKVLVDRFSHTRFEPAGFTGNPEIPMAKSVTDYIFRWLALRFLPGDDAVAQRELPLNGVYGITAHDDNDSAVGASGAGSSGYGGGNLRAAGSSANGWKKGEMEQVPWLLQEDAPVCTDCGAIMVRSGACYRCLNCGASSGCG